MEGSSGGVCVCVCKQNTGVSKGHSASSRICLKTKLRIVGERIAVYKCILFFCLSHAYMPTPIFTLIWHLVRPKFNTDTRTHMNININSALVYKMCLTVWGHSLWLCHVSMSEVYIYVYVSIPDMEVQEVGLSSCCDAYVLLFLFLLSRRACFLCGDLSSAPFLPSLCVLLCFPTQSCWHAWTEAVISQHQSTGESECVLGYRRLKKLNLHKLHDIAVFF